MGMDVICKKTGVLFQRSVWGWRPLWEMCCELSPQARLVRYGQSNDGDGLDDSGARQLASDITAALLSGRAEKLVTGRAAELAALPDEPCQVCGGTGVRRPFRPDELGLTQEEMRLRMARCNGCNGCQGKGTRRPSEVWYEVSVSDLEEFRDFLNGYYGFEIW